MMAAVVYFESIPLEHQMYIDPQLKIVPANFTIHSC